MICFDASNQLCLTLDVGASPGRARDLDPVSRQRGGFLPYAGVDGLDLAAVAVAVKRDDNVFDSGGGERIEQDGLVGHQNLRGARIRVVSGRKQRRQSRVRGLIAGQS